MDSTKLDGYIVQASVNGSGVLRPTRITQITVTPTRAKVATMQKTLGDL